MGKEEPLALDLGVAIEGGVDSEDKAGSSEDKGRLLGRKMRS